MRETNLVRIFAHDITDQKYLQAELKKSLAELEQTNKDLMDTQVQLVQSEKMAAMASLVAGIAHEINTPIGAIASVYDTLNRAVGKLRANLGEDSEDDPVKAKVATILQIISNASDVIGTGSERVVAIVDSMRSFARLDEAELKSVNVQDGLDDTVSLVQHRLGDKIEVIRKYEASDPIVCYPGRLNQVFLCMLDNAIDAMEGPSRSPRDERTINSWWRLPIQDRGSRRRSWKRCSNPATRRRGSVSARVWAYRSATRLFMTTGGRSRWTASLAKGPPSRRFSPTASTASDLATTHHR